MHFNVKISGTLLSKKEGDGETGSKIPVEFNLDIHLPNQLIDSDAAYLRLDFTEDENEEIIRLKDMEFKRTASVFGKIALIKHEPELDKIWTLVGDERASFIDTFSTTLSNEISQDAMKHCLSDDMKLLGLVWNHMEGKIPERPPGSTTEDWMKRLGLLP